MAQFVGQGPRLANYSKRDTSDNCMTELIAGFDCINGPISLSSYWLKARDVTGSRYVDSFSVVKLPTIDRSKRVEDKFRVHLEAEYGRSRASRRVLGRGMRVSVIGAWFVDRVLLCRVS